ncbi:MAG: LysR family transcriptional regulator [Flavobacteriales bacterium]|nr:MAG: LysR family transcriptional regulator [Flavobacteriales bacterium]
MTITQLNYVLALDKSKNFTKAAKACKISQPSLSTQIQKLEEELGVEIFDRTKKPIKSTEIGKILINQFKVIIDESSNVSELIIKSKEKINKNIKFGISYTLEATLLPLFYESLVSKFNNSNIKLTINSKDKLLKKLNNNEIDFIITTTPRLKKELKVIPFYYEPLMIVIPKKLQNFDLKIIEPNKINTNEILVPKKNNDLKKSIIKLFNTKKFNTKIKTDNLETLLNLSLNGAGMSVLPYLFFESLRDEKKSLVFNFSNPLPSREISIVFKKNSLKEDSILNIFQLIKKSLKHIRTFSDVKIIED